MTGTSAAVQATCQRPAYRPYRTAGRKAEYGRFSVLPCPEIHRSLRIKDSVKIDPACGSGGMFVQTGDFVNRAGMSANSAMTFYGQEKVEYNAQLCLMNLAVHGLTGIIQSGDEANTFYHDAHNLDGECDYLMANPPFNVDKVKAESCASAGRLPFGLPSVNKKEEVGNANYLWISYFYSYMNDHGRAGFSSDEELSLYDMLFRDDLSKGDIKKIKDVAVTLLQKVKAKIAELDHWTDKQETKAEVDNLIRDTLWAELPESYDEISISGYRQKIYEYVYTRYPEAA